MAEIHALRSKIQRDLTVELPDGSQRSMSRCDFVVLNPEATQIDPLGSNQLSNLNTLTIPVAFHVIHKTDSASTGYIQESQLDAQIAS